MCRNVRKISIQMHIKIDCVNFFSLSHISMPWISKTVNFNDQIWHQVSLLTCSWDADPELHHAACVSKQFGPNRVRTNLLHWTPRRERGRIIEFGGLVCHVVTHTEGAGFHYSIPKGPISMQYIKQVTREKDGWVFYSIGLNPL